MGASARRLVDVGWHECRHAAAIFGSCAFAAWGLDRLGYRLTVAIVLAVLFLVLERQGWLVEPRADGRDGVGIVLRLQHAPQGAVAARAVRALTLLETLSNLGLGFSVALAPGVLWYGFIGCLVGTLVGVLPGVGPLAGISLLLPATYGLDATRALVMLAGIYYGAMYGGSTTSILMRIPGEAASVMTCIDGYAMARKGRAGPALAIAAVGSYVAGTVSVVALMLLAPPLASFALSFGPPEYFSLLLLGLLVLAYMNSGSMLRGLAMAALGLLLGMIGIDQMSGYFRFAYGVTELGDGIGVVPVAVGLFGLAEILLTAGQRHRPDVIRPRLADLLPSRAEWREARMAHRARRRHRVSDRHHPGVGARDLDVRLLRRRAEAVEAPGGVRARCGGRGGGPGIGEQCRDVRRLRAHAGPGRARRAHRRAAPRGHDGARGDARARS